MLPFFSLLGHEGLEVINPEGGQDDAEEEAAKGRFKLEVGHEVSTSAPTSLNASPDVGPCCPDPFNLGLYVRPLTKLRRHLLDMHAD